MIALLILLWSLCAIYFTHLLSKKRMRMASISMAILYVYIILWIYAVFILDVADLGFSDTETRITLLHGSDIYHSFVRMTDKMSVIPFELLESIAVVAGVIIFASIAVAFHGMFEIAKVVARVSRNKKMFRGAKNATNKIHRRLITFYSGKIIRIHCRMNC